MGASVEAIVFNYNRHTRTYEDYVFTENNVRNIQDIITRMRKKVKN